MTSEEKALINNLLDTSVSYINGYPVGTCAGLRVSFSDDINIKDSSDIDSPIDKKISECTRCPLHQTRTHSVCGMGVDKPLVLVIGEAPGEEEDKQGLPFVGPAGQLLDKMLAAINLSRNTNCYIANILKCRPPKNRDPLPEEIEACKSFLNAQIQHLRPKAILLMGRIAAHSLLETQTPLTLLHGNFYEYKNIPVMVTYHPSALLRNVELKRPAWEDLKKFSARLKELLEN